MEQKTDSPRSQSSENVAASDQIISGIAAPPVERETSSASNDADQEKSTSCIRLSSCFTTDDRSDQNESLAGTSSKVHNECKYSFFSHLKKTSPYCFGNTLREVIHVEPLIDTISSQSFSPNRETSIDAKQRTTTMDCDTFFGVCGTSMWK